MPPQLAFHPDPSLPAAAAADAEIDLAGDRRPRCAVRLPQAASPGVWHGECGCGASFALTVCGGTGDPRSLWLACWERQPQPAPGELGLRRGRQTSLL